MPSRREALLRCIVVLVCGIACTAVGIAAALAPAPPGALVPVLVICVACPMAAALDLPEAIAALRWPARVRRRLEELPETPHPLGF
jgi:hypothetical protein